jgi:hypothetical protein
MEGKPITTWLAELKAQGHSSPAGRYWNDFYELLCEYQQKVGVRRPPAPLILAASGESAASKHQRLAEQLAWAEEHECLSAALSFLAAIQPDQWEHCTADQWYRSTDWVD